MANKTLDDFIGITGDKSGDSAQAKSYDDYRNYDIVIFGENHVSQKHLEEEIEIIKEMKPGYLLLEILGDNKPSLLKTTVPAAYFDLKHDLLNKISDRDDCLMIEKSLKDLYSRELTYLEESKSILNAPTFRTISESEARAMTAEQFNELMDTEHKLQDYLEMRDFTGKHKSFDDMLSTPLHEFPMGYLFKVRDTLVSFGEYPAQAGWLANSILIEKKRMLESGATDVFQLLSAAYKANEDVKIAGISFKMSESVSSTFDERSTRMGQSIAEYATMAKNEGKNSFAVLGANHVTKDSTVLNYIKPTGLSYKVLATDPETSGITNLRYILYMDKFTEEERNKREY